MYSRITTRFHLGILLIRYLVDNNAWSFVTLKLLCVEPATMERAREFKRHVQLTQWRRRFLQYSNWQRNKIARAIKTLLIVLVGSLSVAISVVSASRPAAKPQKTKPINWNHSYYSEKFGLCKKLRIFNPVELVKAQRWSAEIFQRCGPSLVIKYATRYNAPAYGWYIQGGSSLVFFSFYRKRRCFEKRKLSWMSLPRAGLGLYIL